MRKTRFSLGQVLATPGVLAALEEAGETAMRYLARHQAGNWGDLAPEDIRENELSLQQGFRLLSAYILPTGVKIWIITEADRSATTILLPDEY